jgi:hypothetical protein
MGADGDGGVTDRSRATEELRVSGSKPRKGANRVDVLMERASGALAKSKYFECERLAVEALGLAHAAHDYERMARILLPLQEARRNRRLAAIDVGRVTVLDEMPPEGECVGPGCYLLQPPLVGADGRELRERALAAEIPILVVAREPKTRLGLWPIVMIGPVTVRDRVHPPKHENKADLAWFVAATEALGDTAIADVEPDLPAVERVVALLDRLHTVVDHEKLHQALMEACHEAAAGGRNGSHKSGNGRTKAAPSEADAAEEPTDESAEAEQAPAPPRRKPSRRAS